MQKVHFGYSILLANAKLKVNTSDAFMKSDSILNIKSTGIPGFGLGGLMDVRLGEYFNLRINTQLNFLQRNLTFTFGNGKTQDIKIESITGDLPISLKYKSIRHRDFRFYALSGIKLTHDFQSNQKVERGPYKPIIVLKKTGLSYEFGFGFDLYFEYFKFSPEFKMSNSLVNMHSADPYIYSSQISSIFPRVFQISLHFE